MAEGFSLLRSRRHTSARLGDSRSYQVIGHTSGLEGCVDLSWSQRTSAGHRTRAKGRKQSRYHPRWREVRDEIKYERLMAFGGVLPSIRERVEQDLAGPALPREKILAAIVRLMETTLIRVGNVEYARQNQSYGLTTMRGSTSKSTDQP